MPEYPGLTLVQQAQQFAALHHVWIGKHTYGPADLPYTHHLQDVAMTLMRFGHMDTVMQVCAWLHDVIEDCEEVNAKQVRERFGEEVTIIVVAVTDEVGEFANRAARKAVTYPRIRREPKAITLKLADRIANVESGGSMIDVYRREQADFEHALSVGEVGGRADEPMWQHLAALLA